VAAPRGRKRPKKGGIILQATFVPRGKRLLTGRVAGCHVGVAGISAPALRNQSSASAICCPKGAMFFHWRHQVARNRPGGWCG
jgi:hypothetical protein